MRSGFDSGPSHGRSKPGMRRFDTENPHNPAFGLVPAPGRALVADFAARPGGGTRERRDRGRVVVRLHLHQRVRLVVSISVAAGGGIREEAAHDRPFHHRGVVRVRADGALGVRRVRGADHAEERVRLGFAVDDPRRVEDLVAAVLRVRLGEHRELDVGGIPAVAREVRDEVVHLVGRQRQPERPVGLVNRLAAARQHVDRREGLRRDVTKQRVGRVHRPEHGFRHAIVQQRQDRADVPGGVEVINRAALDAADRAEAAVVRDVGGLRRPGRDRAGPRRDKDLAAAGRRCRRAVGQQPIERGRLGRIERAIHLDEMPEPRRQDARARLNGLDARIELVEAERGQGGAAGNLENDHALLILPPPVQESVAPGPVGGRQRSRRRERTRGYRMAARL